MTENGTVAPWSGFLSLSASWMTRLWPRAVPRGTPVVLVAQRVTGGALVAENPGQLVGAWFGRQPDRTGVVGHVPRGGLLPGW